MSGELSSAADLGANELTQREYIAMLAGGAGLCEEAAAATRTEWGALASLVDPLFVLPGEEGSRNYRRAASAPVSRTDTRSETSVALIAKAVAAAVIGGEVADGVGIEVILEGLGQVIGAAAFGLHVSDLHSSGDEPRFMTKTPKMVGELIKGVLNRDRDGLRAFAQEHPEITEFRARLTNAGAPQSASSASFPSSQLQRTRTESCFIKEQQRQAAKDLKAAASGKASFDVLTEAEGSRTIQRLAAMKSDEFADALMAGKLGDPGEPLDQLTRTIFTLSLEHVPAGFGNVRPTCVLLICLVFPEVDRCSFCSSGDCIANIKASPYPTKCPWCRSPF